MSPSEPSYCSLLLTNKGSMLLVFSLAPRGSSDVSLRPSSGLVAPGAHQIFLICTYPRGHSWKQHTFYLQFNFCLQYLKVGGRGGGPRLAHEMVCTFSLSPRAPPRSHLLSQPRPTLPLTEGASARLAEGLLLLLSPRGRRAPPRLSGHSGGPGLRDEARGLPSLLWPRR